MKQRQINLGSGLVYYVNRCSSCDCPLHSEEYAECKLNGHDIEVNKKNPDDEFPYTCPLGETMP